MSLRRRQKRSNINAAIASICATLTLSPQAGLAADLVTTPGVAVASPGESAVSSSVNASTSPNSELAPPIEEASAGATSEIDTATSSTGAGTATVRSAEPSARPINSGSFSVPGLQTDMPLLRGQVSTFKGRSPILSGSVQSIPEKTKVELVVPDGININSEVSQKGDEIMVRVANDIMDGDKVLIPGGWYMRGLVTEAVPQKRGGRDGYVEVQFDKLISPNGDYELDFNSKFSTKDKKLMSVTKVLAKDSAMVGIGAGAGALIAFQMTGIAGTISTHGYNLAVGGAIGAGIGLFAAAKRKGKIRSIYGGDTLKLVTSEPISLPGFEKELLPSAQPVPHLEGLDMKVKDFRFEKPPWNDKSARLLFVDLDVQNNTNLSFNFFDVCVISDHQQTYTPTPFGGVKNTKVAPGKSGAGKVVFTVGSPKRKYSLIFFSRRTGKELSRVAIN